MVIDERSRHQLFLRLEEVLGADQAQTLMEHLPPVGWAEVATKRDLDQLAERVHLRFEALEERMDHRFEALEERIDLRCEALEHKFTAALKSEITAQTRTVIFAVLGSVLGSTSLSLLATRIGA